MMILLPDLMALVLDYLHYQEVRLCSQSHRFSQEEWSKILLKTSHYDRESLKNSLGQLCEEGNYHFVVKSLQLGAKDVNFALKRASENEHIEIVKLLIQHGATCLNAALYTSASYSGNIEIVKLLIQHGAKNLNEALEGASGFERLEIVKLLIQNGANNFNQSLKAACYYSQFEIAKLLVVHGANDWNEALLLACKSKKHNLDIVKLMVEKGANNFDACLGTVSGTYYNWELTQYFLMEHECSFEKAFANACLDRNKPLVQLLLQKGITKATMNEHFKNTFRHNSDKQKKFDSAFADYILGLININQQTLNWALWSATMNHNDIEGMDAFRYLLPKINEVLKPDEMEWVWTDTLSSLMRYSVSDCVQMVKMAVENGAQFSRNHRYPQQKPLVLKLVHAGIDLSILEKAMGGMHKFVKRLRHEEIVKEKERRRKQRREYED